MDDTTPPTPPISPPVSSPSEKEDGEAAAAPDAESSAQDPVSSATAAGTDADGDAGGEAAADDAPGDASVAQAVLATALSSLAVAAASAPAAPVAPAAPQLPLRLPDDLDDLSDADAADLDNDFLALLPRCILPRIDRLKELNDERDAILEAYRVERAALEVKYGARMTPLYEARRGVVRGDRDGAIAAAAAASGDGGTAELGVAEDASDGEGEEEDVTGIPQFWACAMGHVDVIAELITEADVDCLDHLTDVTCTDFPDGLGFELHFHFAPDNPFFANAVLHKRYEVPNLLTEDEPILKNVTGTPIDWKPDQSLTFKQITKKQRKKAGVNAGKIRTIHKKERTESFFHFFTPPTMPGLMDVIDEEEADAVEEAFDHDYDVAQAFRGHLIPKAVLWFTGEAMALDELEEEAEELARAEEERLGGGAAGAGPFPPPAAGEGDNPECKQN